MNWPLMQENITRDDMKYGVTVLYPEMCVRITVAPITWSDRIRGFAYELWYFVGQSFLLAASITCFMYAAGLLR